MSKEFTCFECNYKTSRKDDLKRHLTSSTHLRCVETKCNYVQYSCNKCNWTTNHKNDFNKHRCNNQSFSRGDTFIEVRVQAVRL